jgi:hypothetical protein
VRTTIDIPDELLTQAKILAVQRGSTLRDLVASGLRAEISRVSGASPAARPLPVLKLPMDAPVLKMTPAQISNALSFEEEQDDVARTG